VISIILAVVSSEEVMIRVGAGSEIYFIGGFRNSVLEDETVSSDEEGFVSSTLEIELLLLLLLLLLWLLESEANVFVSNTILLFCSVPAVGLCLGLVEDTDDDSIDDDDDEISIELFVSE
jgi:hypothetical protein